MNRGSSQEQTLRGEDREVMGYPEVKKPEEQKTGNWESCRGEDSRDDGAKI